jgi:hypothetical protein
MAHWAELDDTNKVLRVTVGDNNEPDEGYQWLIDNLGGRWVQTSYNALTNGFRKNYAGTGYTYDETRDAFIPPKPYPSWVLDEETCRWESPVQQPNDGKVYVWDESSLSWEEVLG